MTSSRAVSGCPIPDHASMPIGALSQNLGRINGGCLNFQIVFGLSEMMYDSVHYFRAHRSQKLEKSTAI